MRPDAWGTALFLAVIYISLHAGGCDLSRNLAKAGGDLAGQAVKAYREASR